MKNKIIALILSLATYSVARDDCETDKLMLPKLLSGFLESPKDLSKETLRAIVREVSIVSKGAEASDFPELEYTDYKCLFELPKVKGDYQTLVYTSPTLFKATIGEINLADSQIDFVSQTDGHLQSKMRCYKFCITNTNESSFKHEFSIYIYLRKITDPNFYTIPKSFIKNPGSLRMDTLKAIVQSATLDRRFPKHRFYTYIIPGPKDSVYTFWSRSLHPTCPTDLNDQHMAIHYINADPDALRGCVSYKFHVVDKSSIGADGQPHIQNVFTLNYFSDKNQNKLFVNLFGSYLFERLKKKVEKDSQRPPSMTINAPIAGSSSALGSTAASVATRGKEHKRGTSKSFIITTAVQEENCIQPLVEVAEPSSSEDQSISSKASSTRVKEHVRKRSHSFKVERFQRSQSFASLKAVYEQASSSYASSSRQNDMPKESSSAPIRGEARKESSKKGKQKHATPELTRGTTIAVLSQQKYLIKELAKHQRKDAKKDKKD